MSTISEVRTKFFEAVETYKGYLPLSILKFTKDLDLNKDIPFELLSEAEKHYRNLLKVQQDLEQNIADPHLLDQLKKNKFFQSVRKYHDTLKKMVKLTKKALYMFKVLPPELAPPGELFFKVDKNGQLVVNFEGNWHTLHELIKCAETLLSLFKMFPGEQKFRLALNTLKKVIDIAETLQAFILRWHGTHYETKITNEILRIANEVRKNPKKKNILLAELQDFLNKEKENLYKKLQNFALNMGKDLLKQTTDKITKSRWFRKQMRKLKKLPKKYYDIVRSMWKSNTKKNPHHDMLYQLDKQVKQQTPTVQPKEILSKIKTLKKTKPLPLLRSHLS